MAVIDAFLIPLAALVALASGPSPVSAPPDPPPAAAGRVEGTLRVKLPPARRTAQAYPARGAQAPRQVQAVPAVVWVKEAVPGSPRAPAPVMAQADTAFAPSVLVVGTGTEVTFPNRDPFFHNVFSYSGPARFDLGRYPQGESRTVTFEEPGVVKVYCEVHDFMRAAVIVTASGVHAVVGEDGRFSLALPAGTWTLVAWHPDAGQEETRVTVEDGATTRVDLTLG